MNEEEYDIVRQGRVASLIRSDAADYIAAQRETAINRLIIEYRDGTLTSEKCWGLVGELTALANLMSRLDSDIKMGRDGGERRPTA